MAALARVPKTRWFPTIAGKSGADLQHALDTALRIAYQYIYALQDEQDAASSGQVVPVNPAGDIFWSENILPAGAAAVTPDLALGVFQVVLATTNVLFQAPINGAGVGQPLTIIFIQDAAGSHLISFDTAAYTGSQEVIPSGRGDTYSSISWYLSSSGKWTFLEFHTGIPIV